MSLAQSIVHCTSKLSEGVLPTQWFADLSVQEWDMLDWEIQQRVKRLTADVARYYLHGDRASDEAEVGSQPGHRMTPFFLR